MQVIFSLFLLILGTNATPTTLTSDASSTDINSPEYRSALKPRHGDIWPVIAAYRKDECKGDQVGSQQLLNNCTAFIPQASTVGIQWGHGRVRATQVQIYSGGNCSGDITMTVNPSTTDVFEDCMAAVPGWGSVKVFDEGGTDPVHHGKNSAASRNSSVIQECFWLASIWILMLIYMLLAPLLFVL